ncbi:TRAP transporter large permease [Mesorhizobium delmotii]|uniref:TRAP transporter large permease protein n=1 Tax=Mesorhizobium delmotii TaxID=1631247 RepID=A0A2P9AWW8_9HYPH|nr:TRAP transporter large permease [Mesorhizobium delmotii]SJM35704.1 TRAP dicarboxylate transporter subunit DctM [Mesorhizobium delmotii]
MLTALPLVALVALLLLGVPIAVALAASGMLGIYVVTGDLAKMLGIVALTPFDTVANYALTTIPMFILMAYFSASSGLARDLYTAASNWLSLIRGGLAIATMFSCGVFGAMSGASVAAASVMSNIAMPEMRRHGYSDELAAGAIGVGATLDILIPPSVAMVIYGLATQTSVGKLLVAGIVPGILAGILLALTIYLWVTISPAHAPKTYRAPARERWASLARVWPSLLLIVVVIALLYLGIATPTEVGAVGALMAGVIGVALGRLSAHDVLQALKSTIRISAMIFLILIGATLFGHYMTLSRIPQEIVALVTAIDLNRWVVIIAILAVYFVISMFMDEIPLLLLTLQLTFPLITSLGFDPIWFGVVSMMMVTIGLVFPPIGLVAFVVGTTAGADLTKVYKGTSILTIALGVTTVLLIIFPQIALWLPATMR